MKKNKKIEIVITIGVVFVIIAVGYSLIDFGYPDRVHRDYVKDHAVNWDKIMTEDGKVIYSETHYSIIWTSEDFVRVGESTEYSVFVYEINLLGDKFFKLTYDYDSETLVVSPK